MSKYKCKCGKIATWMYGPGKADDDTFACDDCVPRGCSCNIDYLPIDGNWDNRDESNWKAEPEQLDDKGRRWPCCEWFHREEGYSDEPLTEQEIKGFENE